MAGQFYVKVVDADVRILLHLLAEHTGKGVREIDVALYDVGMRFLAWSRCREHHQSGNTGKILANRAAVAGFHDQQHFAEVVLRPMDGSTDFPGSDHVTCPIEAAVVFSVATPEEEHIGVLAAMNDLRRASRDIAFEDVFQVGRGELADFVVVPDVQVEVFPVRSDVYHTGMWIIGIVGQVVLGDEHDVVIIVAGVFEHAVDVEGIRLVAVVNPSRRGGHHHSIAVL